MIKSLVLRFFSAFSDPIKSVRETEREAIIEARKNAKLKGSEAERLRATKEWSKPENIKQRWEFYVPGKKIEPRYELLPVPDPLPQEMMGQSPSTIQAMLRHRFADQINFNGGFFIDLPLIYEKEKYISPKADMFGARYD